MIAQFKIQTIYLFLYWDMKKTNPIDCFQCQHFYITWDQNAPRGCRAFGFKSRRLPSELVLETSGEECLKFTPKTQQPSTPQKKKDGWTA